MNLKMMMMMAFINTLLIIDDIKIDVNIDDISSEMIDTP